LLHHSDIVEEIAAQRQGEIGAVDQHILEGQNTVSKPLASAISFKAF
jgi:hypothetical protein